MKPLFRLTDQAMRDLNTIWDFIAPDDPLSADRFVARLLDTCELLGRNPRIGRQRGELRRGPRSFPVGNYLTFYRIAGDTSEIVRFVHGGRDLRSIFAASS
jgi:toxin ParE1/3/4